MGMRIRTNVASLTAQRFMSENTKQMGDSFERLSSGYRINKSADDAAGLAISESLRGKIRGLGQAQRNANDAVSLVQVSEAAMNEMTNILIRMRELTVQAATDTIGDRERSFLNGEYVQLVSEIDRIGKSTEFNGTRMFDPKNDNTEFVIQVGTNASLPEENTDTISFSLEGLRFDSQSLGLGTGSEIGPQSLGDSGPARDDIANKLVTVDDALARMASERSTLGSVQNRLSSALNNLGISIEGQKTAMSRIKDLDFAEETAALVQSKIMTTSTASVLSQANASPEMALQLLR